MSGESSGQHSGSGPSVAHAIPTATNGYAITALVSSFVIAPLGIVFGHLALRQIARTGEQGRGLAIGGLVIGYLGTAIAGVWVIAATVFVGTLLSSQPAAQHPNASVASNAGRNSRLGPGVVQMQLNSGNVEDQVLTTVPIGKCIYLAKNLNGTADTIYDERNCDYDNGWRRFVITARYTYQGSANPSLCPESAVWRDTPGDLLCLKDYTP
jgi:hypothetical protein